MAVRRPSIGIGARPFQIRTPVVGQSKKIVVFLITRWQQPGQKSALQNRFARLVITASIKFDEKENESNISENPRSL